MEINKLFLKDKGRCLTPIYVSGETYSFYINPDKPFTDPNPQLLDLQIQDTNGVIVASEFTPLIRAYPFGGASPAYHLYAVFAMPELPNGQYSFVIWSFGDSAVKLTSNIILVENDVLDRTAFSEFRNTYNKYGIGYGDLPLFKQRFRLPIAQIDLQYESDRKQYRNVSDRRLRNLTSYRDAVLRLQAYKFDDDGHEAFSALLEHDQTDLEGYTIEPKSALTIDFNQAASLRSGTVDAYVDNPDNQYGFFNEYGGVIIYTGTPYRMPALIYEP